MPDTTELMTKPQAAYYAAIFAVTNMGQSVPDFSTLCLLKSDAQQGHTYQSLVYISAQQYMESDEAETIFIEEAKMWYDQFSTTALADFEKAWPDRRMLWKYPDAPIVGELGVYAPHTPGVTPKNFKVTGFMEGHPTICTCEYLTPREGFDVSKPQMERTKSHFIWTFNNAGHLKPINHGKKIEYNLFHTWERKPS